MTSAACDTPELFERPAREPLGPGAVVLRGFALPEAQRLLNDLDRVVHAAPWRHMTTPGGFRMSVAMTNCGTLGWCSDRSGYRYRNTDPLTDRAWPALPASFSGLARAAAASADFASFEPDACLVNRYEPGARLTLHQDRDEHDTRHPIVSVSLGLPAIFLFGGVKRAQRAQRVPLLHGDVVVWGGPSRLNHHGVLPLAVGVHPLTGACRLNLTLRRAG